MSKCLKEILGKAPGVDRAEARIFLQHILDVDLATLLSNQDLPVSIEQEQVFLKYVAKRKQGWPVSKIIGQRGFYGRDFIVNEHVLDPRPDSETLIESVLQYISESDMKAPKILDLGTGSGCLIVTLLAEIADAQGVCLDVSMDAIQIARQNALKHDVIKRLGFVHGEWHAAPDTYFDIVISNPPYIDRDVIPTLETEVQDYDPILALDGGPDGLDAYRDIFSMLKKRLSPQGRSFFEMGFDQEERLSRLAEEHRFVVNDVFKDLGEHSRVLSLSTGKT